MARRNQVVDSSDESSDGGDDQKAPVGNHLVDVEAQESSDESDSDNDDLDSQPEDSLLDVEAVDSRHAAFSPIEPSPLESFPQFARLPPELRQRVWEVFCPELASKGGRVIPIMVELVETAFEPACWVFTDRNVTLEQQTENLRLVAAVHHESRDLVIKRFPHTLPLHASSRNAEARFNGDRDILALEFDQDHPTVRQVPEAFSLRGPNVQHVRHIAFSLCEHDIQNDIAVIDDEFCRGMKRMLMEFPHAETAFIWIDNWQFPLNTRWAASSFACHYYLQTHEISPGLGEDAEWVFCWPDFENHPDFCKYSLIEPFRRQISDDSQEAFDELSVKFAPLLSFDLAAGTEEFNRLLRDYEEGIPLDQDDERQVAYSDADPDDIPNEYESEGIDDSEIVEVEESSEDEVIPRPVQVIGSDDDDNASNSCNAEPAGEDGTVGGASRRRKRRVLSDSDDESDDDEPVTKRARTGNPGSTAPRDEQSDASGSSSEAQSGSSDDEEQPPQRLSLAERLRQFRNDNPIPSDGEGSSDGPSYGEDEDEEEEEDEDDTGGGFIDDMAQDEEDESDGSDQSDE